ncbi:NAD(P)-binding protein [Polychaeton citri CBS 116435]|uniref:NAD(P)-binding protein n=1 Tax=Polychaeton citri CBS 116435 TaxID=1314669 RepID=A0A9P4Q4L1_9PEZI|nr:NAD(P)-binding protein [Polychaeton citri CBS 116435]
MNPANLFSVKDMVVVITGGATGIGFMMTQAFALNGAAKVYIVGRRKEKLDEAAKASPHGNIIPVVGDVTSKESLCNVAEEVKKDAGYVNLVICNSGMMISPIGVKSTEVPLEEFAKSALQQKTEDWNTNFATNSTSIMFTTFAFLELLDAGNKKGNCAGRHSQVLVTSSIAGYSRQTGSNMAYASSKAAATHMVKHLSSTLAPYAIRVNAIAPGLFPSELAGGLISNGNPTKKDTSEEGAFPRSFIPAERTGRPEDIAGTVLYLASPAGAYLNGNITVIDGGRVGQLFSTY